MENSHKVLGLDLGTNSIGWALVREQKNTEDKVVDGEIIKLGVRVNPLTVDEQINFEKGRPITTNAERTLKRGARRNLQRYKLRRQNLIEILREHQIISDEPPLTEVGPNSTHETWRVRAKAANERVELEELARILLAINKKRGYKSNRRTNTEDEGTAIDGMAVAKHLYDNNLTPGQYVFELLSQDRKYIPDFYRSDLKAEFDEIWTFQQEFYPDVLTEDLKLELNGQGQRASTTIFRKKAGVETAENKGKRNEKKLQAYEWRARAISEKLPIEKVTYVLVDINNDLNKSSGYLGEIGDRSKKLFMNDLTVGEYLYNQLKANSHFKVKNKAFYRQDYLDEFEKIWETQAKHHKVLTGQLKETIRDVVIFYQRKLKSQKGLLSFCQFESWQEVRKDKNGNVILNKLTGTPKMRTVGHRVIPKSSPLFQEFKIWQQINNLEFYNEDEGEVIKIRETDPDLRQKIFYELNMRGDLKPKDILSILSGSYNIGKKSAWRCNFEKIEGNRTNQSLYDVYQLIAENEGYGFNWNKKTAQEINEELLSTFPLIGIEKGVLSFQAMSSVDKQPSYQLWHLLYSAIEDDKISEEDRLLYGSTSVALKKNLHHKFGFKPEYCKMLANVTLSDDYGNLSARAIRKILPRLKEGLRYDEACEQAGYNHSNSRTRADNLERQLKDRLEILPKNSLRNPVVEKILNQMINVINQIIDEYGRPDEIRVELARELKKSAKEREETTKFINENTSKNDDIRKIIQKDFGFKPTRNDVIRYKLWQELSENGYKTLFTNQYIPREKIFSKDVDIEHIIPKALLFDDSFSNKTLAYRDVNLKKGDRTAFDFISEDFNSTLAEYEGRVKSLLKNGRITKGKSKKLLMSLENLPDGFIERDLRNSQYIAKKAREILQELVRQPIVATTGKITDRLRRDWNLINVMKELNLPKYRALGLTKIEKRWDSGQEREKEVELIEDWTKRNDHRHHAMDALTVAFTSHNHIQYINNLNARRDTTHNKHGIIIAIEKLITTRDGNGKRVFKAPMKNFRQRAKSHIESILVSYKAKNKVVTRNVNKTKKKSGYNERIQLTPRGQLHKETVYGKMKRPLKKPIRLNSRFSIEKAELIIDKDIRILVLDHLGEYGNDPKLAFSSKTLKKKPLEWRGEPLKEVHCFEEIYTIRKDVEPGLKVDKVIDERVKQILQQRIDEYGSPKLAFTDLEKNPIWLNKEKGISIKRVTITGVKNAEPLHHKKDHLGEDILVEGSETPVDYVSPGNNHHVAIYRDEDGKLQENVVSFYEAVSRVMAGLPIVDKTYNQYLGWEFLFTMKQNEMFVFPSDDFDPNEIDLLDETNYSEISKHLFRVQKISTKNYLFNHHLNTEAITGDDLKLKKQLESMQYHSIRTPAKLVGIIKVRLNHLGKIVEVIFPSVGRESGHDHRDKPLAEESSGTYRVALSSSHDEAKEKERREDLKYYRRTDAVDRIRYTMDLIRTSFNMRGQYSKNHDGWKLTILKDQ